jgi:hypothetical protein
MEKETTECEDVESSGLIICFNSYILQGSKYWGLRNKMYN